MPMGSRMFAIGQSPVLQGERVERGGRALRVPLRDAAPRTGAGRTAVLSAGAARGRHRVARRLRLRADLRAPRWGRHARRAMLACRERSKRRGAHRGEPAAGRHAHDRVRPRRTSRLPVRARIGLARTGVAAAVRGLRGVRGADRMHHATVLRGAGKSARGAVQRDAQVAHPEVAGSPTRANRGTPGCSRGRVPAHGVSPQPGECSDARYSASHSGQPSRSGIADGLQAFKLHVSSVEAPFVVLLEHHRAQLRGAAHGRERGTARRRGVSRAAGAAERRPAPKRTRLEQTTPDCRPPQGVDSAVPAAGGG